MRLAGYLTGVMGTGEHARQLAGALKTQGIPVTATTLHGPGALEDDSLILPAGGNGLADRFADVNLLCVNADSVAMVAEQLGPEFFNDRYTIGFWAWEVGRFPRRFAPAFDYLDEVWVGSRHVRDAISPDATAPVVAIPQPVSLASEAEHTPAPAGLPAAFRFLFAFDYLSVFERKNPLATIAAFARAFAPGTGASLIVKSLNHEHDPAARDRLRAAAAGHADVYLIEKRLTKEDRDGLMGAADCYVSLHRAEGFGYTLAESMWLGRPVIATGYSGNLDFMTAENSYLVDHRLVPIGPGNEPYPADGVWAEPDIDHAARLMREVFDDRDGAARRGARAAADIRASHGPEAAGRAMARRLEIIADWDRTQRRGVAAHRRRALNAGAIQARISGPPPAPPAARFGGPQRAARTGLLRLLKPVTVHQRLIDEQLLAAIESMDAELKAVGAAQAAALARIESLERGLRDPRAEEAPPN